MAAARGHLSLGPPAPASLACFFAPTGNQIAGWDYWRPCASAELRVSFLGRREPQATVPRDGLALLTNERLQLREVSGAANHDSVRDTCDLLCVMDQKDGE